jgi:hypothetical protein
LLWLLFVSRTNTTHSQQIVHREITEPHHRWKADDGLSRC